MSERILKALMQLFAIVANVGHDKENSREFVRSFLKQQLSRELLNDYLIVYDKYFYEQNKKREGLKARKRTSLNSVKVLKICNEINKELTQKQKIYVLLRLIEFVFQSQEVDQQTNEFIETVSESFNIEDEEYRDIYEFINSSPEKAFDNKNFLLVNGIPKSADTAQQHYYVEGFNGSIRVLYNPKVNSLFMRYFGNVELQLNGQIIVPDKSYVLTQGSSIRANKISPIYYSDVINSFLTDVSAEKINFDVENISYKFKNGKVGLHPMELHEKSGKLIGIMGASGSGKSTLLNVLNGSYKPSSGAVKINGYDIYNPLNKDKIEGVIGYVSQDDLLIEELSVFQNIYYNAKLCFGNLNEKQTIRLVIKVLNSLGLDEIKDLKVGSPLDKTISGGQRKRVNIALELIREPSIMFVDEPTSGLSSRDSENIMDLLKELSLRGKLIFVVIHQPSSDIFKMFDKLIILDIGGYLIYNGNPVDAIIYFKEQIGQANSSESECPWCGNVNPEQIFNIIEMKVIDEYGNLTDNRKIKPKEWSLFYQEKLLSRKSILKLPGKEPENNFSTPSLWKQFSIFMTRDVLSKLTNKQYLLINFLEAPVLAFILSYIIKYSSSDEANNAGYIYRENENIIAYIFMSVIVALFMGLTVSAEEIIRDRKILKREKFLNLSKGSYIFSKISVMFIISAIQTFTFVLVGNSILEIKGMYFDYWLILFTTACFANMMGLNISAAFDSVVTIYILIPFLLIPQLILSGVIVKFDRLNPSITTQDRVPYTGEIMASKWAFEAISVNQFKNNAFNKVFYYLDKELYTAGFRKNFWLSRLKDKLNFIERNYQKQEAKEKVTKSIQLIKNEINKENKRNPDLIFEDVSVLDYPVTSIEIQQLNEYFENLNTYYIKKYNAFNDLKDQKILQLNSTEEDKKLFIAMKDEYTNESLSDLMTNKNDFEKIIESDNKLIQRAYPVYKDPEGFSSHFLAPTKLIFGKQVTTYSANLAILWIFSLILGLMLYSDFLRRLFNFSLKYRKATK